MKRQAWRVAGVFLPDGDVVEDHWIRDGALTSRPPRDISLPRLPGRYILPGLVDAHAHVTVDYTGASRPHGASDVIAANLRRARDTGVLDLRDVGAPSGVAAPPGGGDHPRVHAAGRFLAPDGRYIPTFSDGIAPADLVSAAVGELATGAAWVKVVADFPNLAALRAGDMRSLFAPESNYDQCVLTAVIDAVHAGGGRVAVHSTGPYACDLVRMGVDSVEHGLGLDETALALMAAEGTAWTPTLTSLTKLAEGVAGDRDSPLWTLVNEQLERWSHLLPLAARLGVVLLTGTDDVPFGTVPGEVRNLTRFGVEPSLALAAATTAARSYLGYAQLADGGRADLVTYHDDPRDDPAVLDRPAAVVLDGRRLL